LADVKTGVARLKILGGLSRVTLPDGTATTIEMSQFPTPVLLGDMLSSIQDQYGVEMRRDSILILVNGTEASLLQDLETIVGSDDEVVVIPMFHGG
jgi:molybdopterin converting factor small subunit